MLREKNTYRMPISSSSAETFSSISNLDHCICPEPCEQEYYDTKNSIAQWPSNYLRRRLSEEKNITEEYIR